MKKYLIALATILALSGVGTGAYFLSRPQTNVEAVQSTARPITVTDLFNEANAQRRLADLPELMLDPKLNQSACQRATMVAEDWSHDGYKEAIWPLVGKSTTVIGENLSRTTGTDDDVVDGWMGSITHRANILNQNYTQVGYCVTTARPPYKTIVVQHLSN